MNINKVLEIAKNEIGYKEGRGNYSKYGDWYGEPGYSNAAWCAMFVSWCFDKAGSPLPAIQHEKGFAYCPFGVSYFRNHNQLFKRPKRGDIVFFDWNKDRVADHVGLVLEVKTNGVIITVEGNTSVRNQSEGDLVMKRTRSINSCCGFARPYIKSRTNGGFPNQYFRFINPLKFQIEVKKIQSKLKEYGYSVEVDGFYGQETEAVIKQFQQSRSLEVDGIVGQQTWQELFHDSKK